MARQSDWRRVLAVDARQLCDLADTDDTANLERAAALYRGQFLSDLAMEEEEFRDWASSQRARLDSAAGLIMSKLANRADEAGDLQKALYAASRLVAIDPLREDWLRVSLEISARYLARDEALMQARRFIGLLRQELDVAPEPETIALIERIKAGLVAPARSRKILSAASIGAASNPAPAKEQPAVPLKSARPANVIHWPAAVSTICVALVAVLVASLSVSYKPGGRIGWRGPGSDDIAAIDRSTTPLLILPVQSETAETAQFARVLTENVLTSVSRFSGLTVFDGSSITLPGGGADTRGIRFAAWGAVRRQGAAIYLNLGLSDTANRTLLWADDLTVNDDIATSRDMTSRDMELTGRIARDLQVQTTYAQARGVNDAELDLAATNQLVAKALTIQYGGPSSAGGSSATPLYEEVLRRDSDSPIALTGIAAELIMSSSNLLSERQSASVRAERLLVRALQINPRIERAYYWLGVIYLGRGQRDLALQSFDRALALNPAFIPAEAHAGFALVLSGHAAEGLGRIENALATGSHDPNERLWLRFAGIAQLELGNDKQALDTLLTAASLAKPTAPLHAALASAYALTGQRSKSQEQFRLTKELADPAALEQLLNLRHATPVSTVRAI